MGISLIFICYRVTPGFAVLLPWLAVVTPGLCRRCPGKSRGVSGRTGTHRSASGATPGMYRRKLYLNWDRPWSFFSQIRVWSVALPGKNKRTQVSSRFVPVCPGPPATNCRGAPERTQCERGLTLIYNLLLPPTISFSSCSTFTIQL